MALAKARVILTSLCSVWGAVFGLILFVNSKSKSDYGFASLIGLYARFARSRRKGQHVIHYQFEADILKNSFSELSRRKFSLCRS